LEVVKRQDDRKRRPEVLKVELQESIGVHVESKITIRVLNVDVWNKETV
jgi:hypothetical protein